ncbi:MAG: Uma2 family endonuclease [Woronichinia naegeliana WA131]|jgi:Uma2 family endonuclease|uniref:Uma2 family endonuclease n=1 Tax=Woronichinia naegeliana WA131 TaxID=2824559 RepID=A0A977L0Z7_9CYAN|nr:MAG: Uma2 family endonuclease [Woronichinia naegeliana WA131]
MVIAQEKPTIATVTKTFVTLEEYRAIAETAEERYEYCNGEMIVMSGGTVTHSAITINILVYLGFLLRDTDFRYSTRLMNNPITIMSQIPAFLNE